MSKRAVSPVIATVLLIALVTAAAAIVFLVVMPMLKPAPDALITPQQGSTAATSNNRKIQVDIKALNGDLNISSVSAVISSNGTTLSGVTIEDAQGNSLIGSLINKDQSITAYIVGPFVQGTQYSITISFTSGGSTISKTFDVTA